MPEHAELLLTLERMFCMCAKIIKATEHFTSPLVVSKPYRLVFFPLKAECEVLKSILAVP